MTDPIDTTAMARERDAAILRRWDAEDRERQARAEAEGRRQQERAVARDIATVRRQFREARTGQPIPDDAVDHSACRVALDLLTEAGAPERGIQDMSEALALLFPVLPIDQRRLDRADAWQRISDIAYDFAQEARRERARGQG